MKDIVYSLFLLVGHLSGAPIAQDSDLEWSIVINRNDALKALTALETAFEEGTIRDETLAEILAGLVPLLTDETREQSARLDRLFQKVLPQVQGETWYKLANAQVFYFLEQNRAAEASTIVEGFESGFPAGVLAPEAEAVCYYHLGRVREQQGQVMSAVDWYLQAFTRDPAFSLAVQRIYQLALGSGDANLYHGALSAVETACRAGLFELARTFLELCLTQEKDGNLLLNAGYFKAFIVYLSSARVGHEAYDSIWAPNLEKIRTPSSGGIIDRINIAYQALGAQDLATLETPNPTTGELLDSGIERTRLASFWKVIGDSYFREGGYNKALGRYHLAWTLDKDNLEAGLALGATLVQPETNAELRYSALQNLMNVFSEDPVDIRQGQADLAWRFHRLLGDAFYSQGFVDAAIPRWEASMAQREILRETLPGRLRPAPELRENLGNAKIAQGQRPEGLQFLKEAQEEYQSLGLTEHANRLRPMINGLEKKRGAVVGIVLKNGVLPMPGVRVELKAAKKRFSWFGTGKKVRTTTNAAGRFIFSDLADGQYIVQFTVAGRLVTRSATIINGSIAPFRVVVVSL